MPSIFHIPQPVILLANSASTSSAILVQDYNTISLQIDSAATNASLIVQGSNVDGLQPDGGPYGTVRALAWSTITTFGQGSTQTNGIFSVAPGFRWLRVASPNSACTAILTGNAF